MSTVDQAREELERVTKQLKLLAERGEKLKQFMALSEELGFDTGSRQNPAQASMAPGLPTLPPKPVMTPPPTRPKKSVVADLCAGLLADGFPMKSGDLVREVVNRGVEVGGKEPAMALSAILSKDERFVPSRKLGWSLKTETPETVAAVSGVDSNLAERPTQHQGND